MMLAVVFIFSREIRNLLLNEWKRDPKSSWLQVTTANNAFGFLDRSETQLAELESPRTPMNGDSSSRVSDYAFGFGKTLFFESESSPTYHGGAIR